MSGFFLMLVLFFYMYDVSPVASSDMEVLDPARGNRSIDIRMRAIRHFGREKKRSCLSENTRVLVHGRIIR